MRKVFVGLVACTLAIVSSQNAGAMPIDVTYDADTGHWYGLVAADNGTPDANGYYTRSWGTAEANALASGGQLVTINDAAENAWLVQTFAGAIGVGGVGAFIGLEQAAGSTACDQGWSWVSGQAVTYVNWNAGEPNDADGIEDGTEQFSALYLTTTIGGSETWVGYWNDLPTKTKNDNMYEYGIAEYTSNPVPDPASTMMLLGLGMTGLAVFGRKKVQK